MLEDTEEFAPWPMATRTTMAITPMMIPSMVRNERILLLAIRLTAMRSDCPIIRPPSYP